MNSTLFKTTMYKVTDKLLQTYNDLVYIGDMNSCPKRTDFISDFCDVYGMKNLINSPTCHKGAVPSLLDVVLVTNNKKYMDVLNCKCTLSDFHNFVGAATRKYAPIQKPRYIVYRSYRHLNDENFVADIVSAPFHVGNIFDDTDDMAWFYSRLLSDIVDQHAPLKTKKITRESVPYMNGKLRKALYQRNMARNKFN